ncbi:MAG: glycosyltransferase [Pseudomonadota bacterium]
MPRYFFVVPEVSGPVGGVHVLLNCVDVLADAGYDAYILYSSSHYTYRFADPPSRTPYFHPPLAGAIKQLQSRRTKFKTAMKSLQPTTQSGRNHRLEPHTDDVFMIPEFAYPEYASILSDYRCILIAQDVFSLSRAFTRDLEASRRTIDQFDIHLCTSEASRAAVAEFAGRDCDLIPQVVSRASLDPSIPKKQQIAYMPRKRHEEINTVVRCLTRLPEMAGWPLVRIEGVSALERDTILSESLIFLSFSFQEGFGLPPAEAMAAGCLVIGYTGVGGEEYFSPEYGYPIQDCDIVDFITTIKAVTSAYATDPKPLDRMREHAATHIHTEYNTHRNRTELLRIWAKIDEMLRAS